MPSTFSHTKSPEKRKSEDSLKHFHRREAQKKRRIEEQKRQVAVGALMSMSSETDEHMETDEHTETGSTCEASTQTDMTLADLSALDTECQNLRSENIKLKTKADSSHLLGEKSFMNNPDKVKCFTGLPNFAILMAIFNIIKPDFGERTAMSPFHQFLMTCMRMRLNLTVQFCAYLFGVSVSTASRNFNDVINILDKKVVPLLIVWPGREALRQSLPTAFRGTFMKCVSIIDCFEIFIDKPKDLKARSQTYSQYKGHNTMKFLIGITPQGVVCFISKGWGGRASDPHITANSGFLDNLLPGDQVLADRGFTISDQVGLYCATVEIPAFTKGKKQLSSIELENTRELAAVRIHVERVIGVTRQKYTMLQGPVPITLLQTDPNSGLTALDKIVRIACAFTNACESVVPFD